MEINDEKFNAIAAEIIKKAGLFKCPVCGHTDGFDFKPYQYVIMEGDVENGSVSLGGSIIKSFIGTCPYCSYMLSFDIGKIEKKLSEQHK